ncbi:MAG: hypothetical protein KDB22_05650 [Planctomycetales bacterium]|nr:hypothetical protein [Planctomycetales bacterium]
METIKQLWITSVPFRILICLSTVSLVLALTTSGRSPDVSNTESLEKILSSDDEQAGDGLLEQIQKHLPGSQPTTAVGKAAKAAKDMTDLGAKVGTGAAKAGIDVMGDLADEVISGVSKSK